MADDQDSINAPQDADGGANPRTVRVVGSDANWKSMTTPEQRRRRWQGVGIIAAVLVAGYGGYMSSECGVNLPLWGLVPVILVTAAIVAYLVRDARHTGSGLGGQLGAAFMGIVAGVILAFPLTFMMLGAYSLFWDTGAVC